MNITRNIVGTATLLVTMPMKTALSVILCLYLSTCHGLQSWDMQTECGGELGSKVYAGELQSWNQIRTSCTVVLKPKRLPVTGSDRKVILFYFTAFVLDSCDKEYVSITDGPYLSDIVKGLPAKLCGYNQTLVKSEQYFVARGDQLNITYRRPAASAGYTSRFELRFLAVSDDYASCSGNGVHQCSNTICIPSDYACSDDIRSCGETDSTCDGVNEDEESRGFRFTDIFTYMFIVVLIMVGLSILKACFKKCQSGEINTGLCDCFGKCCESLHKKMRRCRETAGDRVPDRIRNIRNHFTNSNERSHVTTARADTHSTVSDIDITLDNRGYDDEVPNRRTNTAGLPPSYNEVMAIDNMQRTFPSSTDTRQSNITRTTSSESSVTTSSVNSSDNSIMATPSIDVDSDQYSEDVDSERSQSIVSVDSLEHGPPPPPLQETEPRYPTPPPPPDSPPPPEVPPPSYEEAIGEPGSADAVVPGYDEYMADHTKFTMRDDFLRQNV